MPYPYTYPFYYDIEEAAIHFKPGCPRYVYDCAHCYADVRKQCERRRKRGMWVTWQPSELYATEDNG